MIGGAAGLRPHNPRSIKGVAPRIRARWSNAGACGPVAAVADGHPGLPDAATRAAQAPSSARFERNSAGLCRGSVSTTHIARHCRAMWFQRRIVADEGCDRAVLYFRPELIASTRLPCASSPLNSQKNAPPRFWAFT